MRSTSTAATIPSENDGHIFLDTDRVDAIHSVYANAYLFR